MKISARNKLVGTIVDIHKGATTSHVTVEVAGAKILASITNESVDELGLKVGQPATAIIKSSDVIIGVE